MKSIEPFSTWIVTAFVFGRPLTVAAMSNQRVFPVVIAVEWQNGQAVGTGVS